MRNCSFEVRENIRYFNGLGHLIPVPKMRQTILATILTTVVAFGWVEPGSLLAESALLPSESVGDALRVLQLAEAAGGASLDEATLRRMRAAYRDLLERHPEDPEVSNAYAAFLLNHGSLAEALDLWRKTLKREPGNAEAAFQLGHAQLQMGEAAAALEFLQQAAQSPRATAFQVYSYANALYLFRREDGARSPEAALDHALAEFGRAAQLEPANLEFARGYAETFFALKDPDWTEALLAWRRVVALTPESHPSRRFYLLQAARAALEAGQPSLAEETLDRLPPGPAGAAEKKLRERIQAARED